MNFLKWAIECSGSQFAEMGALSALTKVVEDSPGDFEVDCLSGMVLPLLGVLKVDVDGEKVCSALRCLTVLVGPMPSALSVNMEMFLGLLSSLTGREETVRRGVCRALVSLLSLRPEYLQSHFPSLCEFMLSATGDDLSANSLVMLEATEFWLTFASLEDEACTLSMIQTVQGLLPRLVPILLKNTVYPLEDREDLLAQGRDLGENAPVFHRGKGKSLDNNDATNSDSDNEDDKHEDHLPGGEDANANDGAIDWNLRKCSAASIDSLSNLYGPEFILPPLLPALQEGLSHQDLWVREASILVLGAIAEGCQMEMHTKHLAQLHPFLLHQLTETHTLPPLKAITCWTLSRYADYVVYMEDHGAATQHLTKLYLELMLDQHYKVQLAACSALGVLVETAAQAENNPIINMLPTIYQTIVKALDMYRHQRCRIILFDTLGVLADFIGEDTGRYVEVYLPPLLEIWNQSDVSDRRLLSIMETMASVALAIGGQIQNYALLIFNFSFNAIEQTILRLSAETNPSEDESDFILAATDIFDAMVEGMGGSSFSTLVSSSPYANNFLPMIVQLCKNDVPGVRLSVFALVGDLTRHCPQIIQPALVEILTELTRCIDTMHANVCNNAIWSLGEIALKCVGNETVLHPFAEEIISRLKPILAGDQQQWVTGIPGLAENASACLGRLAKVNANFVSKDLGIMFRGWCEGLARITDPTERNDGFTGLVVTIYANPNAIIQEANITIPSLVFAIVSWHIPPNDDGVLQVTSEMLNGTQYSFRSLGDEMAEIGQMLAELLHKVMGGVGEHKWEEVKRRMPVNVRKLLKEVYGV